MVNVHWHHFQILFQYPINQILYGEVSTGFHIFPIHFYVIRFPLKTFEVIPSLTGDFGVQLHRENYPCQTFQHGLWDSRDVWIRGIVPLSGRVAYIANDIKMNSSEGSVTHLIITSGNSRICDDT